MVKKIHLFQENVADKVYTSEATKNLGDGEEAFNVPFKLDKKASLCSNTLIPDLSSTLKILISFRCCNSLVVMLLY